MINRLIKNIAVVSCLLTASVNTFAANSKVSSKTITTTKPTINHRELVASILIAEAGGEGIRGIKCVMEVIRVRMKNRKMTMFQVITERNAFSCLNKWHKNYQGFINKHKKHPLFNTALWVVDNYKGTSITNGSNFYHERKIQPFWSRGEIPRAIVGRHLFFAIVD